MKTIFWAIPWLILLIPFFGLAYFYQSLPNDFLIDRLSGSVAMIPMLVFK